jgi:hypothetical protein
MTYSQEYPFPHNRLVSIMGGAEVWMEFAGLTEHAGFRDALAEFGIAHAETWAEARQTQPLELFRRANLRWSVARLVAWAGEYRRDQKLKRQAWNLVLNGEGNPDERHQWRWPMKFAPLPPMLSSEGARETDLGANNAAAGSLNLIACLALAPAELDSGVSKRDT